VHAVRVFGGVLLGGRYYRCHDWAWLFWGFWAATVATGVLALTAHRGALGPALIYADLLRSAFDLYRGDLLSKLGFALPDTLAAERLLWSSLQSVLYRGATSEEGELALDEARKRYVSHPAGNK